MNLLEKLSQETGITPDVILSRTQKREIVEARYLYIYLLYNRDQKKICEIKQLTGIHHSTIIYATRRIDDLISIQDKRVCEILKKIIC